MRINSIDELKKFLLKDKDSADINPVRFINVETLEMWFKVKSFLTNITQHSINLSDFCETEDTTPNFSRLKGKLKETNGSTLLTPLSEHLRVNNSIILKTIEDLFKLEFNNNNDGKLKIYIPIYRMKEVLNNIQIDSRNTNSIIFLNTEADCDYSLTIIQNNIGITLSGNEIFGYKKYLIYWEQNPDKPIILHTQNAIHYTNIVYSDDVKVIINAFHLLKYHFCIPEEFTEEWGNEFQWSLLARKFSIGLSIEHVFCNILRIVNFDYKLFLDWKNYSDFEQWILWIWSKTKKLDGYIGLCLTRSKSIKEFKREIQLNILSTIKNSDYLLYYNQRYELISSMNILLEEEFWIKLSIFKPIDRIKCLTNLTDKEKKMIIECLQAISFEDSTLVLEKVYPDLYYYLSYADFVDPEISNYFNEYRWQKVINKMNDSFADKVEVYSDEKCEKIWAFPARNKLVNDLYDNNSIILFVDAMGLEYCGLLLRAFNDRKYSAKLYIGHCNLPSITEQNNDFFIDRNHEKIYDLDSLKHKYCEYPTNIIEELKIIEQVINKVNGMLTENNKVILVSDHGTSRLAILSKNEVFLVKEGADKYKYGRYCIDNQNDYSEYSGCLKKGDYWIFSNYNRFSSQGAPLCETHGGATFEEMLVPVITISRSEGIKKSIIIITLLTKEVKMPIDRIITVQFRLSVQIDNVKAFVGNIGYKCKLENGIYSFNHKIGNESSCKAKIISENTIGEITYKIIKGISSNFDI